MIIINNLLKPLILLTREKWGDVEKGNSKFLQTTIINSLSICFLGGYKHGHIQTKTPSIQINQFFSLVHSALLFILYAFWDSQFVP